MWELDYKEGWVPKNWCFQTVVLKKTLESPLYCKKIKAVKIIKEINPQYSLEGLMLKLKLQYFGHLMGRTDSWKRPWCCESLKAGEGEDRGGDGWMLSSTQWTWVWASSGKWWRTGKPGMLQSMRSQRGTWLSDWRTTTQVSVILNTLEFFTFKWELLFHILCLSNDSSFLDVTNLLIEINLLTI